MSWRDPKFRYTPVAEQEAGYLRKKFDKILREQKARSELDTVKKLDNYRKAKAG